MKLLTTTAILFAGLATASPASAQSPVMEEGRAVIAGLSGTAEARLPKGPRHDGVSESGAVAEGNAYSAGTVLTTRKDGRLCVVLTPGAVLCVAGETQVEILELSERPQGLPTREAQLVRRIKIRVDQGAIRFYGGQPSPNQKFEISFGKATARLSGGSFELAGKGGQWRLPVLAGNVEVSAADGKISIGEGHLGEMDFQEAEARMTVRKLAAGEKIKFDDFELCDRVFTLVDPLVFQVDRVDLAGLADLAGVAGVITFVGDPSVWEDVSPTAVLPAPNSRVRAPGAGSPVLLGRLMPRSEIWDWYSNVGVIRGVNYLPRNAVNPIEMWQAETFKEDLIKEELGWARDAGLNALRVPLSYVAWRQDPEGFIQRMKAFLDIAAPHGFRTAFVLLDDTNRGGRDPAPGPQPDPIPGVYNSQWLPSVAPGMVTAQDQWPDIEKYIKDVVSEFKRDDRVIFWDVYQTPGNNQLWDKSLPLLESAFKWVREMKPQQPLTAGPWTQFGSPMSVRILELSDFISLQTFDDPKILQATLNLMEQFHRPVVCTDWLKRQSGNDFKGILPVFSERKVGWFSRGLVKGRSQLIYPEGKTWTRKEEPVWQQDLIRENGKFYSDEEIRLIRSFQFK